MMTKTAKLVLIVLALLCSATPGLAQETTFADFKREMMPQVGKTISVEGVLRSAKLGWMVEFDGFGVYIYAKKAGDVAKMNLLNRYNEQAVKVTGKLGYAPAPKIETGPVAAAVVPEHFFFDVAHASVVSTQKGRFIREVPPRSRAVTPAPEECLRTFREFFRYVQRPEPGIIKDQSAQARWLSKDLLAALKKKVASFKDKTNPDFPSNSTFLGFWDRPTIYTILGSRRYAERAVIDISFSWGAGTEYAGDTRLTSYVFVLEEGSWKLEDMYTFKGKYASAESLNAYLTSK